MSHGQPKKMTALRKMLSDPKLFYQKGQGTSLLNTRTRGTTCQRKGYGYTHLTTRLIPPPCPPLCPTVACLWVIPRASRHTADAQVASSRRMRYQESDGSRAAHSHLDQRPSAPTRGGQPICVPQCLLLVEENSLAPCLGSIAKVRLSALGGLFWWTIQEHIRAGPERGVTHAPGKAWARGLASPVLAVLSFACSRTTPLEHSKV